MRRVRANRINVCAVCCVFLQGLTSVRGPWVVAWSVQVLLLSDPSFALLAICWEFGNGDAFPPQSSVCLLSRRQDMDSWLARSRTNDEQDLIERNTLTKPWGERSNGSSDGFGSVEEKNPRRTGTQITPSAIRSRKGTTHAETKTRVASFNLQLLKKSSEVTLGCASPVPLATVASMGSLGQTTRHQRWPLASFIINLGDEERLRDRTYVAELG